MMVCQTCGHAAEAGAFCGLCGGTLAESSGDDIVGTQVGPYKVTSILGEGGMGRVYLGVHPGIGSRVAIKVLSPSCSEKPDLVDRFFAEAKAVNLIRHESIVNVLDLARLPDGRPYIVMEYLDGAPLSAIIQRGPLPLGSALRLATEVLGALSAAHKKRIIHRDLKPDNIFVSPQGRSKVLDFGIAKLLPEIAGSATPTQTGALLGTPHYMSPEQALAKSVDHRADIYAMGLILFECVTGQGAFNADSLYELLHRQVHEPPPYPKTLRPDLPDNYQDVIMAALVKDPERRIQSAEEFIQRLGAVGKTLPGDAWAPIGTNIDAASAQMAAMATPTTGPGGSGRPLQPPMQAAAKVPTMGASSAPTQNRPLPAPVSAAAPRSKTPLILGLIVVLVAGGATAGVLAMSEGDDDKVAASSGDSESDGQDDSLAPANSDDDSVADKIEAAADDIDKAADKIEAAGDDIDKAGDKVAEKVEKADDKIDDAARKAADLKAKADKAKADKAKADKDKADKDKQTRVEAPPKQAGTSQPIKPKTDRFSISVPNKRNFDIWRYLPQARMHAKRIFPDAHFYRLDATGVKADGKVDLLKQRSNQVTYRFFSPRAHARPSDLAPGLDWKPKCVIYVYIKGHEATTYLTPICNRFEQRRPRPRCSPAKAFSTLVSKGADPKSYAEYNYYGGQVRSNIKGTRFSTRGCR